MTTLVHNTSDYFHCRVELCRHSMASYDQDLCSDDRILPCVGWNNTCALNFFFLPHISLFPVRLWPSSINRKLRGNLRLILRGRNRKNNNVHDSLVRNLNEKKDKRKLLIHLLRQRNDLLFWRDNNTKAFIMNTKITLSREKRSFAFPTL